MGATVVLFTVGARRQVEGPVKTRVKVCCESKPYFRYRRPADRCHADRGRPAAASFREYSAQALLYTVKTAVADAISNTRHGERYHQYAAVDAVVINPLDDSINHLSGNRHMLSPLILHWRLAPPGVK